MLEMTTQKRFDLKGFLSDNVFVHLPRVEGARQPAKGQAAAFFQRDTILFMIICYRLLH